MTSEPPASLDWSTEQRNPASLDLDTLSTAEVVATIVAADAAVPLAVAAVAVLYGLWYFLICWGVDLSTKLWINSDILMKKVKNSIASG